ncbi:Enterobacterial putative membrane protein (DUF943) [Serratia plymuthica]|nr:Enterobacterial putative membrane protein (DUF943) [Serratia plymuthica]
MKIKRNKTFRALLLIGCALIFYFIWLSKRTVEIVDIHQRNNYSDVLVTNFPFTDKGKINWWLKNKGILKEKYNIPKPASDGFYTVIFLDFGEGYQEEDKYDRLCFEDMKTQKNCIDKMQFSLWTIVETWVLPLLYMMAAIIV